MRAATFAAHAGVGAVLVAALWASGLGTTQAAFEAAAPVTPFTVVSGNLDLTTPTVSWADVSPDVPSTPIALNGGAEGTLGSYRFTGGDQLRVATSFTISGAGNNLKAKLWVGDNSRLAPAMRDADAGAQIVELSGAHGTLKLYKGIYSATSTPNPANLVSQSNLGAPQSAINAEVGTAYTAAIDIVFDDTIPDDTVDAAVARLSDLVIHVEQVRS